MAQLWSKKNTELVIKLWFVDGLSAGQIMKLIPGVTRNAVIGKVARLRRNGIVGIKRPKERLVSAPTIKRPVRAVLADATAHQGNGPPRALKIKLMGLMPHHCRWIVDYENNELAKALYCGVRAIEGSSYCAYHCTISYVPLEKRRANGGRGNERLGTKSA